MSRVLKPRFQHLELLLGPQNTPALNSLQDSRLTSARDLYSLGATLWEMLTGRVLFRGAPGEVMHQHQHAPLPLEQLKDVPQPLAVLLEMLLEKDPAKRPQSPAELLKEMATIRVAIEAGRRIAHQGLQKTPPPDSVAVTRRAPARLGPRKISVARLPITGSGIFGRPPSLRQSEKDGAKRDKRGESWANGGRPECNRYRRLRGGI